MSWNWLLQETEAKRSLCHNRNPLKKNTHTHSTSATFLKGRFFVKYGKTRENPGLRTDQSMICVCLSLDLNERRPSHSNKGHKIDKNYVPMYLCTCRSHPTSKQSILLCNTIVSAIYQSARKYTLNCYTLIESVVFVIVTW
jgi:hypothetical protein